MRSHRRDGDYNSTCVPLDYDLARQLVGEDKTNGITFLRYFFGTYLNGVTCYSKSHPDLPRNFDFPALRRWLSEIGDKSVVQAAQYLRKQEETSVQKREFFDVKWPVVPFIVLCSLTLLSAGLAVPLGIRTSRVAAVDELTHGHTPRIQLTLTIVVLP